MPLLTSGVAANTTKRPPGGRAGATREPCTTLPRKRARVKGSRHQGLGLGDPPSDGLGVGLSVGDGDSVGPAERGLLAVSAGLGLVTELGLGAGSAPTVV